MKNFNHTPNYAQQSCVDELLGMAWRTIKVNEIKNTRRLKPEQCAGHGEHGVSIRYSPSSSVFSVYSVVLLSSLILSSASPRLRVINLRINFWRNNYE
jgi:hypothetical protein